MRCGGQRPMDSGWIGETTESDFEENVIAASKTTPVLVDFWAAWCGPCRMLTPILERVVNGYQGKVRLVKVNTDENPSLAGRYRIQGIPAVKAFVDGHIVDEFVGVLPERQIREFVDNLVPSEADLLAQKGRPLEERQPLEAMGLYEEALRHEPQHAASLLGKLRLLLALERIEEARLFFNHLPAALQFHEETRRLQIRLDLALSQKSAPSLAELRARVSREPENLQHRFDLAIRLAAEGEYEEALETDLAIVRKDRRFKEDGARKAMLQIFEVIGPRSPLAEKYREKLAEILF
ncbi:MAG: thioredoxin [Candidatus Manganitrophaceae bacterium]|nr:MAG: thioredoxin [Candidatus Manganitrophaceae bacterium]